MSARTIMIAVALVIVAGCGAPSYTPTNWVVVDGGQDPGPTGEVSTSRPSSSRPPSSAKPSKKPVKLTVVLDMAVSVRDDGSVSMHVESNLPDGTELGGSVFGAGGFMTQYKQVLKGGTADFGPYSANGKPIPSGTYDVSVTMPSAAFQPASVRTVIGQHGEYLTGPLVERTDGTVRVSIDKKLIIP
jgi:hypothetical protein